MYKPVEKVPLMWDSEWYGPPVVTLEDEYGGESVIGVDDHCFVLFNGSEERDFRAVTHWHEEAVRALVAFLNDNPSFKL